MNLHTAKKHFFSLTQQMLRKANSYTIAQYNGVALSRSLRREPLISPGLCPNRFFAPTASIFEVGGRKPSSLQFLSAGAPEDWQGVHVSFGYDVRTFLVAYNATKPRWGR